MIVDQDYPGRTLHHGCPKDLPGMNEGGIQNPPGNQDASNDPVLGVEQECVKLLLSQIPEKWAQPLEHVPGATNGPVISLGFSGGPPPKLHGGGDASRSGATDTRLSLQDPRWVSGQASKGTLGFLSRNGTAAGIASPTQVGAGSPETVKELVGHLQGRAGDSPTPDEDCEELSDGEGGRPKRAKAFPWTVSLRP